jgi:hypothetical protein
MVLPRVAVDVSMLATPARISTKQLIALRCPAAAPKSSMRFIRAPELWNYPR